MHKNRWFFYFLYPVLLVITLLLFSDLPIEISRLVIAVIPAERLELRSAIGNVAEVVSFSGSLFLGVLWGDFCFWITGRSGRNASMPPLINRITRAVFGE